MIMNRLVNILKLRLYHILVIYMISTVAIFKVHSYIRMQLETYINTQRHHFRFSFGGGQSFIKKILPFLPPLLIFSAQAWLAIRF